IQKAVDAADTGDTIKVAAGMYSENITMKEGTDLIGAGANLTIIDGGGRQAVIAFNNVKMGKIQGFTITNGANYEGGITCRSSSPTIINNRIINNGANGIYCVASSPIVLNNVLSYNGRTGIVCTGGHCNTLITNNVIAGNGYGGIRCYNVSFVTIVNNTIFGHWWSVILYYRCKAVVKNNIIGYSKGGNCLSFHIIDVKTIDISYNNIWGLPYYYGLRTGLMAKDPLFVNVASGDFRLRSDSPCIGAGDPDPKYNDPNGTRNDMGAYGGPGAKLLDTLLDITPPPSPILDRSTSPTKQTPIKLTGDAEPKSTVKVFINGVAQRSVGVTKAGSFSVDVDLDEGENRITVRAIDASGNISEEAKPIIVILDTILPDIPILNLLPLTTSEAKIVVGGSAEPKSDVEVFVNEALNGSVRADDAGRFNIEVEFEEGINEITSKATDMAGNISKSSAPIFVSYQIHPLWNLPVMDIMGVGKVYSEKLEAHGVNTIADMVSVDVSTLSEKTGISLYKLYMWKRRAVLAMDV
ncbi:right-handed parallel beta-helix repeat-containing protein, partial [Candidatus Pacearchaeota archaeon]|nr:right-handed parallel beta-helix repeat-containing protein [Candidatus Pacearchaeota archaeon]